MSGAYGSRGGVAVLGDGDSRAHQGKHRGGDLHPVSSDDWSSARTSEAQVVNESELQP